MRRVARRRIEPRDFAGPAPFISAGRQVDAQGLGLQVAFEGILREKAQDDGIQDGRDARSQASGIGRGDREVSMSPFRGPFGYERQTAGQELEESDSEGVKVAALVPRGRIAAEPFGRGINVGLVDGTQDGHSIPGRGSQEAWLDAAT
ncbi:hypothetical protein P7D22_11805 [Lichenihabitans sp. Uapishka_5]|uniref:hypothetical protein n=1 Tax=Lichenihabitans sp. Uapishka_5 TaxID=3037302 RepID=UPI0029E80BB7|nr:hypothetical protein [Lichenihabitans sp. Uapishka_5]MDX7951854.1 hypothetical protein [Lichenihabitans sp. Uapishka_5]